METWKITALESLRAFFSASDACTTDAKTLDLIVIRATNFVGRDRTETRALFTDFACVDGVCIEQDAIMHRATIPGLGGYLIQAYS